ncbi:MAG TPA: DUF1326 domain-containing protein [Pyrinomonadaceae bacterium]|nr:DUF1326 domain-containing protein [Pyrinomonadaceae bacterium]
MRKFFFLVLALMVLCGLLLTNSRAEFNSLKGDYVEVRTASVFAGACHYNGEVVTTGRDALMAWQVNSGNWNGVDLSGVRVVAVVSSDSNLSDTQAPRRSELIVDKSASRAQELAIIDALKTKYSATLGKIVSVKSAPVEFKHEEKAYSINSSGIATINMESMPDDLCCRMPQLVWYEPLIPLAGRKVGYTREALYAGGAVGDSWQRDGENSAFYGSFSF